MLHVPTRVAAAAAVFAIAPIGIATAQSASLIAGFNRSPSGFSQSLGKLFFIANRSLWVSNGTMAGTAPIAPSTTVSAAGNTVALDGVCYFLGSGPNSANQEPWRSDGTLAGTFEIVDLYPGSFSSNAGGFSVYRDRILFSADVAIGQSHTFVTDGTAAGTVQLGPDAIASTGAPYPYVVAGASAYFVADESATGSELWRTDGTPGGTQIVADIRAGTSGSGPTYPVAHGNLLFFAADDGSSGNELWRTDGTQAGTVLVADIRSGSAGSTPRYLVSSGGYVYFEADDGLTGRELWRSDGSAGGTVRLTDEPSGSLQPRSLTDLGGKCLFAGSTSAAGVEPWISDGTVAGTMMIQDTRAGTAGSVQGAFAVLGEKAYFAANDGALGTELWVTDGTSAGTMLGTETVVGAGGSAGFNARAVNGRIVFDGVDPLSFNPQLWAWGGRASTQVVGRGCGNFPRIPTIGGRDPVLGSTWRVFGDRAFVGAAAVLAAGAPSPNRVPIPFGDCALYADPSLLVVSPAFVVAQADWFVDLPIPNAPALSGVLLAWQAVFVGTDNPGVGWDATPGLYVHLGD